MKTAIILAARKERDCSVPYPLMPIESNGECLIDRTLSILRELNFSDIYIVVGYCADLYEKYKASDVAIIVNPDYEYTASMGSLVCVEKYVSNDFLLIEGDVLFERKVLEQLKATDYKNCFCVTEESGNGDEAFIESRAGFITKISKDKHQICRYEGELLGVSKLSYETFQAMLNKWRKSNNPYLNYEYLFFDCTDVLDRPYIFFPNLIWGDVDIKKNYETLINYTYPKLRRKENPFDYENIISHLQDIFPDLQIRTQNISIEQIGGMSNKNFKVIVNSKQYVLRIPGPGSDGMVERSYEEINSLSACKLGINPEIYYFNPNSGIKLAHYVNNAETLNCATIQRPEYLKIIAVILRKLHDAPIRLCNEFNVFREILKYEHLLREANGLMYQGYEDIRPDIMELENTLNEMEVLLKPCHNDLVPENFIKDELSNIYLIDWEYSGMNDPLWDIAAMFLESNFEVESQNYFLNKYYLGEIPKYTKRKIFIYQILMDILWSIWTCIKEAKGEDLETYGMDRYQRAMENLKRLKYESN